MDILSGKSRTRHSAIQALPEAPVLHVPLTRHFGTKSLPMVAKGDNVCCKQLIGCTEDGLSMRTHAPVSGRVIGIEDIVLPDQSAATLVMIENDFQNTAIEPDWTGDADTPEKMLEIIDEAGIVGMGGAQFPTAAKYASRTGQTRTFIVNGAECEPFLTADYALMAERTEALIKGILLVDAIVDAGEIVIGIESKNRELESAFLPWLSQEACRKIRLAFLPDTYPQGSELQLIRSITGLELPRHVRPTEAGIIVSNVATIYAIHEAIINRQPLIRRIVTISGERVEQAGNYEVSIGTPVSHILKTLGIASSGRIVVLGGPMMGRLTVEGDHPIGKGTGGLIVLPQRVVERLSCIGCGYCVEACPMHLMPMKYEALWREGRYASLEKYSLSSCIECAACEYVCPSNVPLIESIREGKRYLRRAVNAG